MKRWVSVKVAGMILLLSMGLLALFHILVLLNVVPSNVLWGGQIDSSTANLYLLESIALVVIAVFALLVAAKMGYIRAGRFGGAIAIGMWVMFVFLILNTIGNLASDVSAENFVFAPVTLILAFCVLRLAIEP